MSNKAYEFIFGPVSSRRFGSSLGIDLSPKDKCCNFDCLYCELERTKTAPSIKNSPRVNEIINELKSALDEFKNIDVITITANGEPSLYPNLKELISKINSLKQDKKSLILSNGTAVLHKDKFNALLDLDIVKFSLDSAIQKTFRRIDRNLEKIDIENLILKMAEFKDKFKGELVMEILVIEGFNDNELEFNALNLALNKILPDRVDISTIDRPPAYGVVGVCENKLYELSKLIISTPTLVATRKGLEKKLDFSKDELRKLLKLRPQSKFDIEHNFSETSKLNLESLIQNKEINISTLAGIPFYKKA